MKTQHTTQIAKAIFWLTLSLTILAAINANSQTIIKNVPIESEYPYLIKTWAHNPETNSWGWYEISYVNPTGISWYIERSMKCEVDQYDVLDVMFIRGMENCGDTTRVKIYGSYQKEIIKDRPELRKVLYLDGKLHEYGTKIKRPEQ